MELAEPGMIGATKTRIPLCFMQATCYTIRIEFSNPYEAQRNVGIPCRQHRGLRKFNRTPLAQSLAATYQPHYQLAIMTAEAIVDVFRPAVVEADKPSG